MNAFQLVHEYESLSLPSVRGVSAKEPYNIRLFPQKSSILEGFPQKTVALRIRRVKGSERVSAKEPCNMRLFPQKSPILEGFPQKTVPLKIFTGSRGARGFHSLVGATI